jgi:hypothetical protein
MPGVEGSGHEPEGGEQVAFNLNAVLPKFNRATSRAWIVCGASLLSFGIGSISTARLIHSNQMTADGNRVFELNVYHAVPGKVTKLEDRFREASKLMTKHNLEAIAYWVPNGDPAWADTFIYIVAAPSREAMEKNWGAFHTDPEFQKYRNAEKEEKLIEKVDSTYMRPTDFSALK